MTLNNLISPLEVAAWLVAKTSLTFDQISKSTGLGVKEVEFIADGSYIDMAAPANPIEMGIFNQEDIEKAQKDSNLILKTNKILIPSSILKKTEKSRKKKSRSLKKNIPNCVAYIIQNIQEDKGVEFTDSEIASILGSTKNTITSIRTQLLNKDVKFFRIDPVSIGLCSKEDLDKLINKRINGQKIDYKK